VQRGTRRFVGEHGLRVDAGPFQEMTFTQEAVAEAGGLVPKLLGAYEQELHDPIQIAVRQGPETIVNVGAGDGYYAVGLALEAPRASVFAFDIDPRARRLCSSLASANGVADRVQVRSNCDHAFLSSLPSHRTFLFVDCEGCERELLAPKRAAPLSLATILVELHEVFEPGLTDDVLSRFSSTHDVRIVVGRDRDPARYPKLLKFSPRLAALLISEGRPEAMRWALLEPRGG
jgi:hypothetical protein